MCIGAALECELVVNEPLAVRATFATGKAEFPGLSRLQIVVSGRGRVVSDPPGTVDCREWGGTSGVCLGPGRRGDERPGRDQVRRDRRLRRRVRRGGEGRADGPGRFRLHVPRLGLRLQRAAMHRRRRRDAAGDGTVRAVRGCSAVPFTLSVTKKPRRVTAVITPAGPADLTVRLLRRGVAVAPTVVRKAAVGRTAVLLNVPLSVPRTSYATMRVEVQLGDVCGGSRKLTRPVNARRRGASSAAARCAAAATPPRLLHALLARRRRQRRHDRGDRRARVRLLFPDARPQATEGCSSQGAELTKVQARGKVPYRAYLARRNATTEGLTPGRLSQRGELISFDIATKGYVKQQLVIATRVFGSDQAPVDSSASKILVR